MLEGLIRNQSRQLLKLRLPLPQVFYSDSAVAITKLKSLEHYNRNKEKKEFNNNFIENLFLNKIEKAVLEYPEINTLKELKFLQKQCTNANQLVESYSALTKDVKCNSNSEKIVNNLKELELCGFQLPITKNGFGYENMEYTYMLETLSSDLPLSKTISENEDFGLHAINTIGNEIQKKKYLPQLASGKSMVCFAHYENKKLEPLDPVSVKTTAVLAEDGKTYVVSGVKNWTYNATHANAIILSATVIDNSDNSKKKPTLFLIDKNINGITVHKTVDTLGIQGIDICALSFDKVIVPLNCILGKIHEGEEYIKNMLSRAKLSHASQCITTMKKLINMTITHCIENKTFTKNKYESDFFKIKIGRLVSRLYVVESMTYLVAGRMDCFNDPNLFLESLILKIYSSETLQYVLNEYLAVIGTDFYSTNQNFQILQDSLFFISCDEPNDWLRIILCAAGCKHVMEYKSKNSTFFNTKLFQNLFFHKKFNQSRFELVSKKLLYGYLHLMFKNESNVLEDMIHRLKESADFLIKKHQEKIYDQHVELKLLADLVIYIYAFFSTLGRASRAYCLGVRFCEADRCIVDSEAARIQSDFLERQKLIMQYDFAKNIENIGNKMLNFNSYSKNYPNAFIKMYD